MAGDWDVVATADAPKAPPGDWDVVNTTPAPDAIDNSWLGAAKGDAEAALALSSGALVGTGAAAARTVNRILPDWVGGADAKVQTKKDIDELEKRLTYQPQTPEGQDALDRVAGIIKPVANVAHKATAAVVGDENVPAVADAAVTLGLPGVRGAAGAAGEVGSAVASRTRQFAAAGRGEAAAAPAVAKAGEFDPDAILAPSAPAAETGGAKVAAPDSAAPAPSGKAPEAPVPTDKAGTVTSRAWDRVGMDSTADAPSVADPVAYGKAKQDYAALKESEGGKVLSTDTARELSPDYSASKESRSLLSREVHEPSSDFVKQVYAERLAEAPKAGELPEVMFTAGGTGAGKTTGIANIPELQDAKGASQIVYDTNMNSLDSARTKIDQALAADKKAHIVYVYRDPVEAFANGTLSRAEGKGRTVPIEEQANTHAGSYETVMQLRKDYANDPRVKFTAVDNSRGKGNAVPVPFQSLAGKRYNVGVDQLRPVVEQQFRDGKISKRVYDGTLGEQAGGSEAAVQGPTSGAGNGGGIVAGETQGMPGVSGTGQQGRPGVRGESQPQRAQGQGPGQVEFEPPAKEGSSQTALPPAKQAANEAALRAIGLKETRHSALTGDTKETGIDFQTAKLDNAAGKRMHGVLENERAALREYSDNLIDRSGGTTGTDQISRQARGRAIVAPIQGYDKAIEQVIREHYKAADAAASGKPIQLHGTREFLANNRAAFLGTTDGKQLYQGVTVRAKELGLLGPNGTFNPATVEQAERLRQYLNDNWSPKTGRLIGQIKNELDEDVARAAGADVYAASRALRALRARTLEEPEGVSELLAPDDKLGINNSVAHEDVPKYLTKLGADQFKHVIDTLREANKVPELKAKTAAALGEIRATFANGVKDAGESTQGMWNAKAVNKYLRDNNARMQQVFTPAEIGQFKTLNDAGNALRMDRTYPGAAAQGHNFVVGKVVEGIEHGAAAGGALLGHIPGAIVGHVAGKVAGKVSESSLTAAVEKRIRKL